MTTEGQRRFSSVSFQTENWIENLLSNTDNTKMSLLYPEPRIDSAAPFASRRSCLCR